MVLIKFTPHCASTQQQYYFFFVYWTLQSYLFSTLYDDKTKSIALIHIRFYNNIRDVEELLFCAICSHLHYFFFMHSNVSLTISIFAIRENERYCAFDLQFFSVTIHEMFQIKTILLCEKYILLRNIHVIWSLHIWQSYLFTDIKLQLYQALLQHFMIYLFFSESRPNIYCICFQRPKLMRVYVVISNQEAKSLNYFKRFFSLFESKISTLFFFLSVFISRPFQDFMRKILKLFILLSNFVVISIRHKSKQNKNKRDQVPLENAIDPNEWERDKYNGGNANKSFARLAVK